MKGGQGNPYGNPYGAGSGKGGSAGVGSNISNLSQQGAFTMPYVLPPSSGTGYGQQAPAFGSYYGQSPMSGYGLGSQSFSSYNPYTPQASYNTYTPQIMPSNPSAPVMYGSLPAGVPMPMGPTFFTSPALRPTIPTALSPTIPDSSSFSPEVPMTDALPTYNEAELLTAGAGMINPLVGGSGIATVDPESNALENPVSAPPRGLSRRDQLIKKLSDGRDRFRENFPVAGQDYDSFLAGALESARKSAEPFARNISRLQSRTDLRPGEARQRVLAIRDQQRKQDRALGRAEGLRLEDEALDLARRHGSSYDPNFDYIAAAKNLAEYRRLREGMVNENDARDQLNQEKYRYDSFKKTYDKANLEADRLLEKEIKLLENSATYNALGVGKYLQDKKRKLEQYLMDASPEKRRKYRVYTHPDGRIINPLKEPDAFKSHILRSYGLDLPENSDFLDEQGNLIERDDYLADLEARRRQAVSDRGALQSRLGIESWMLR